MSNKVIIFSAPSGSGKSTIVGRLLADYPNLEFSISATSRAPRGNETDGREYYFFTREEFEDKIRNGEFVEYEEVYEGSYYGTLKSEVERIWAKGHAIIFDIDVKGGVNLKSLYGDTAMSVFIMPPDMETLKKRLESRGTDSAESIEKRLARAKEEMEYRAKFDHVVVNDDLETAVKDTRRLIDAFLAGSKPAKTL